MEYGELFEAISDFEQRFYDESIEVVPGYAFNQYNTIKRIVLYYSGKFEKSQKDSTYFHNMSRDKVRNGIKNIDLDTKDLQIISDNPIRDKLKVWVTREKTKKIFKKLKIGRKINACTRDFCQFGTLVLKKNPKSEGYIDVVDLRNLVNEPTCESLDKSPYVIENHYLLPRELIEISKDWDNREQVKEVLDKLKEKSSDPKSDISTGSLGIEAYINLKEVYGIIPESWIVEGGDKYNYVRAKMLCIVDHGELTHGWMLWSKVITDKEFPYKEVHFDRVKGRWLGLGLVEEIFDPQTRKNELVNLRFSAMRFAALMLLQTQDNTILRNILSDLENGDILTMNQLLTRVPTEMRDHSVFQMEENDVEGNAAKLTNSFEVTSGESLPSGTPYSLGALMDRNVNKYYEYIREEFGLFWTEIYMGWLMPYAVKDFNKQELLKIIDPDMLSWVREELAQTRMWESVKKYILNFGRKPRIDELDFVKNIVMNQYKDEIVLDIPDGYLKDFEYEIDLLVTGENLDKRQSIITLSTILQILGQNPQMLDNPVTKRLFAELLDISGISIGDIGKMEAPRMISSPQGQIPGEQLAQAQASIPLPLPQAPIVG